MKNNLIKSISIIVLIIALFALGWSNFQLRTERSLLSNRNLSLIQDSTAFEKTISSFGDTISLQRQMILSESQAKKILQKEFEELKKIKQNTKVITKTEIKRVLIPSVDTLIIDRRPDGLFMRIPQTFSDSTDNYTFSSTVMADGLQINSLTIPNTTSITVGRRKTSFFKRAQPVVLVDHSNPYVSTVGMTNITVDYPVRWYETRVFNIGLGFAAGYMMAK